MKSFFPPLVDVVAPRRQEEEVSNAATYKERSSPTQNDLYLKRKVDNSGAIEAGTAFKFKRASDRLKYRRPGQHVFDSRTRICLICQTNYMKWWQSKNNGVEVKCKD